MNRYPEAVQTLYAELLDQLLRADAELAVRGLPPGSLVSKEIRGRRYWYLQIAAGRDRRQHYLGPDSAALRVWMEQVAAARRDLEADDRERARLGAMLGGGGLPRLPAPVTRVLSILADLGVFRRGGVLVGTHAFHALGNVLGVELAERELRTQDVDIAQDLSISIALSGERVDASAALRAADQRFVPVPGLDLKAAPTSFRVRGRDLRVDFLTPARSRRDTRPVPIRHLGVAAEPLPFLDYLIEGPIPAVVLGGQPVLVRVPDPARFALHKLWTAAQRPVTEQVRARKDRRQASALLEVLAEDRPADLGRAWQGLSRRGERRQVTRELEALSDPLRSRVTKELIDEPPY